MSPAPRLLASFAVLTALSPLAACGDDTRAPTADTVNTVDTAPLADGEPVDAFDAGDVNAIDNDGDALDAADAGCTLFDEPRLLLCHGVWTRVSLWSDWGNASCATHWTFGPDTYASVEALAAAVGCDATCVLRATMAVDFVDCDGHRNGFETYESDSACGGPVYGTASGVYTDLCLWPLYACHCEEE